jgi:hypothetical protein
MLGVTVHPTLSAVQRQRWDAAVPPGRGGLLHAFLAPCASVLDEGQWRVFTVGEAGADTPVAVSAGVIHRVDLSAWLPPAAGRALALARRLHAGLLRPRVLELGPPCWPGAPLACTQPALARACAVLVMQEAWRQVAVAGQADVLMVRDFAGARTPAESWLEAERFVKVAERPTFVASLDGRDLAGYVAAMRSPYRRRAHRYLGADLTGRDSLKISVIAAEQMRQRAGEIARLCALTTARSTESRRERVGVEVIAGWAACQRARAVLIEDRAGVLLLAAVVVLDPPVLHFIRVGFDETVGRQTGVYPRLLYELVRLAAAEGCQQVDLGLTSADPKLRAGARPLPLRVWARHRNPLVQRLLRAAIPRFSGAPAEVDRNVFREPPPPFWPSWYGEAGSDGTQLRNGS